MASEEVSPLAGVVAVSPSWPEGCEEDDDPSAVVPDSPVGAPSAPVVEDEEPSEPAEEASPGVDGADTSDPLDPLEDSDCWAPPDEVSGSVAAGSVGAGSDEPWDAASLPLLDGASSEAAAEGSPDEASCALATPAGSSISHATATSNPAQSQALERLFLA